VRKQNGIYLRLTIIFAMAVCIVAFLYVRLYLTNSGADVNERVYDRYYVMITDDYKSSFWQSVYSGAQNEASNSDTFVELLGANLYTDYTPEELMEIAISSDVDGIMVYGNGSEEMTNLIDEATDKGIPVVTMYSDNATSKRCSFVGVSGYNIGREYGRQIVNIKKEKTKVTYNGANLEGISQFIPNITILMDSKMDQYAQNVIMSGIQDILTESSDGPDYTLETVPVDNSNPFSVEESIRDVFMQDELPNILVCLNELETTCAYQAVVDYNMVGSISILGYYDSEKILNAINRNVVYSSIAVDTGELGKFCVQALNDYHEFGNTSQYYAADITLINKNNVSDFIKKEEEADVQ